MQLTLIQGFYITPSARTVLGTACLEGAFNWERTNPNLKRLTIGLLDMNSIEKWSDACFDANVEPLLVLGPDDQTPDEEKYPGIVGIKLLSAHVIDSPDMQAIRGILHEPDEIFTAEWEVFAAGHRAWFVPPGPVGADGEVFWPIYREALKIYDGPVLGLTGTEFVPTFRNAWRCSIKRRDLSESGHNLGGAVRFDLQRFPFSALNFDTKSQTWSSEGWFPEDLERIDPDGIVRRVIEEEIKSTVPDWRLPA